MAHPVGPGTDPEAGMEWQQHLVAFGQGVVESQAVGGADVGVQHQNRTAGAGAGKLDRHAGRALLAAVP